MQTADQQGHNVNMMWVDTDGCVSAAQYCKYFITSVEKGIQTAVKTAVLGAAHGTFKGGNYIGTLANGGVDAGPVPRLRQQGPGRAAVGTGQGEGGHRERQHQDTHQEPGVTRPGSLARVTRAGIPSGSRWAFARVTRSYLRSRVIQSTRTDRSRRLWPALASRY